MQQSRYVYKIAGIYYTIVTSKAEFTPVNVKEYRARYNQAKISFLERKLAKLKADGETAEHTMAA